MEKIENLETAIKDFDREIKTLNLLLNERGFSWKEKDRIKKLVEQIKKNKNRAEKMLLVSSVFGFSDE